MNAKEFCKYAHNSIGQKRKYSNEPYWRHPYRVAYLVSLVSNDIWALEAAYLHDIVEDVVPLKPEILTEMKKLFCEETMKIVYELTDVSKPEDGNRETRKRIDREHIAKASDQAKLVKTVDLIDNLQDIAKHDKTFLKTYLKEMKLTMPHLKIPDFTVWNLANKIAERITYEQL